MTTALHLNGKQNSKTGFLLPILCLSSTSWCKCDAVPCSCSSTCFFVLKWQHFIPVTNSNQLLVMTIYTTSSLYCNNFYEYKALHKRIVHHTTVTLHKNIYRSYCCHGNNKYTYSVGFFLLNGYLVLSLKQVNRTTSSFLNNMDNSPD